jgi:hypothetical protein
MSDKILAIDGVLETLSLLLRINPIVSGKCNLEIM